MSKSAACNTLHSVSECWFTSWQLSFQSVCRLMSLRKQQTMGPQVLVLLALLWETQMEFQVPSFNPGPAQAVVIMSTIKEQKKGLCYPVFQIVFTERVSLSPVGSDSFLLYHTKNLWVWNIVIHLVLMLQTWQTDDTVALGMLKPFSKCLI